MRWRFMVTYRSFGITLEVGLLDFYTRGLLVDNLDEFNAYPLGTVLCIETYNSIIKAMSKKVQNLIYGKISNKVYPEDNYSMVNLHLLLW